MSKAIGRVCIKTELHAKICFYILTPVNIVGCLGAHTAREGGVHGREGGAWVLEGRTQVGMGHA
jgi:hypothetical protein